MNKREFSGCCLWFAKLGLAMVCMIIAAASGSILLANTVDPLPTLRPITTCEGLLQDIHRTRSLSLHGNVEVDKKYLLNVYQVQGDQISGPHKESVPLNLLPLQNDLEAHILIWDYFASIIPAGQRMPLTEYRIFTDGSGNKAGYSDITWANASGSETWALEIDLADYQDLKSVNDLLVHEFGHMLTLNFHQFDARTDPAKCQFYIDANQCSFADSYINRFFDQFWKGKLYDEWKTITAQADQSAVENGLAAFYKAHARDFVREYAATSPKEDLADSWMYFVMTPKPFWSTIADQKVLFFYNFPELVSLRSEIRGRICKYHHMPEAEPSKRGH